MDTNRVEKEILISPYGGGLKNLLVAADEAEDLKRYAETLPSITMSERSLCDLELLASGAFSPLDRFMSRADYDRVLDESRLASGHIFPIPITLPVDERTQIKEGTDVALRDSKQNPLAVIRVEEIFPWNMNEYALRILNTTSYRHPLVAEMETWGDRFVSGPMRVFQLPKRFDFSEIRLSPSAVRSRLETFCNPNVVAFQTRNPLHRAHEEMTKRAVAKVDGALLMHPVVGLTRPGDIDHFSRVRTYKVLTENYYEKDRVLLALLPLAMRFAGPREALWHALIRRNYGAKFFIVGRDHASPGVDENGRPFYGPKEAQALVERHSKELGVGVIPFEELVYSPETRSYKERPEIKTGESFIALSGSSFRKDYLEQGQPVPEWFMRPEVAQILDRFYPARHRQGVCVWFTGLSGSGKSTTAEILTVLFSSHGRRVTLLDGDIVRNNLSAGLGFDKAGRDANIRRIGFVASEIVRHGGVAVCAAISPYREVRDEVRKMVGENFVEVFVSTPLEICEQRDPKGLYAKARRGELANFTGVDDVYEPPVSAEITIDASSRSAEENAELIIHHLRANGLISDR